MKMKEVRLPKGMHPWAQTSDKPRLKQFIGADDRVPAKIIGEAIENDIACITVRWCGNVVENIPMWMFND